MHAILMTSFVVALMGSVVAAQTSSVANLFLIGFDYGYDSASQAPFVGSIIASDATATTYSITCGSTTASPSTTSSSFYIDSGDCGVPPSFTFTQGPSTVAYTYTMDDADDLVTIVATATDSSYPSATASGSSYPTGEAVMTLGCVIAVSSSAVCSYNEIESDTLTTTTSIGTTTVTGTEYSEIFSGVPVTITAGPASVSGSATKTSSSASATNSNKSSASGSAASTSNKSSTSGSAASTGGMPMITAKAQWVVGGAAAAMVMAVL